MNEEIDDIEALLRRWRPRELRDDLTRRIALDLECPPRPLAAWWQRLGFNAPWAAAGWGLAVPALVILTTINAFSYPKTTPSTVTPAERNTASVSSDLPPAWQASKATNQRLETNDDGVVLDALQRPVRRTRYRSEDTVSWRNASTGAELEVSYPREDVVMIPVTTR